MNVESFLIRDGSFAQVRQDREYEMATQQPYMNSSRRKLLVFWAPF